MLALSLARRLEIMGQAASKITEATRVGFPRELSLPRRPALPGDGRPWRSHGPGLSAQAYLKYTTADMATAKPLVEDYIKDFFRVHPEQIHFGELATKLRRLDPGAGLRFAEAVVNQKVNELADRGWLQRCGDGEFKKSN